MVKRQGTMKLSKNLRRKRLNGPYDAESMPNPISKKKRAVSFESRRSRPITVKTSAMRDITNKINRPLSFASLPSRQCRVPKRSRETERDASSGMSPALAHWIDVEKRNRPSPKYLTLFQPYLTKSIRTFVVDTMKYYHKCPCDFTDVGDDGIRRPRTTSMELSTLFLAVNIFDRYMEKVPIIFHINQIGHLLSVGAACMWIATKIEDIHTPHPRILYKHVNPNPSVTWKDILAIEVKILRVLNYRVWIPTVPDFIGLFLTMTSLKRTAQNERVAREMCDAIATETLGYYPTLKYSSSLIAASILSIANNLLFRHEWPISLEQRTGIDKATISPCAVMIFDLIKKKNRETDCDAETNASFCARVESIMARHQAEKNGTHRSMTCSSRERLTGCCVMF